MFHRDGKKAKSTLTKPLKDLTAIMEPVQLLSDNKRQDLVLKIKKASTLDASRYDSMCLSLIHNVVNCYQSLPETTTSYYALSGGLFDHALNRTEAALQLFRQYLVQGENSELSEEQKLWLYALFSAGMLQGVGKLYTDYRIDLFDNNGQLIKQWQPLLDMIGTRGGYYYYELQKGDDDLRCRLNLLLAHRLMPPQGFAWIVSNPQVLAIWLALLNEDSSSAGTFGAIIDRADAIAIQRSLNELLKQLGSRGARTGRITTFADNGPESSLDKERLLGAEFIKWLTTALAKGDLVIDKGALLVVSGGLLMSTELFQFFIREHPEYKNWLAVQKGFLSLGLHVKNANAQALSRVEQLRTQQLHQGIVVAKYETLLPDNVHVNNPKTGDVAVVSSIDFAQQLSSTKPSHLSLSGRWESIDALSASQLERKPHG